MTKIEKMDKIINDCNSPRVTLAAEFDIIIVTNEIPPIASSSFLMNT